jgi:hypothetical protein
VSPAGHDEVRAAAALLATTAHGSRGDHLLPAILDGLDPGQLAAIAAILAHWLVHALADAGTDPVDFAKQAIADSIAAEAAEGTP